MNNNDMNQDHHQESCETTFIHENTGIDDKYKAGNDDEIEDAVHQHPTSGDDPVEPDETNNNVDHHDTDDESPSQQPNQPLKDKNNETLPKKKARTAYFIFLDEKRKQVQETHSGESIGSIAKIMGQMWSTLSPDEKAKYQLQAEKEKEMAKLEQSESKNVSSQGNHPKISNAQQNENQNDTIIPIARVKKICRLDPEVRGISKEAILLITKAAECFTQKLGSSAAKMASMQKNRRTILSNDIYDVCSMKEPFFFLRDDIRDLIQDQKDVLSSRKKQKVDDTSSLVLEEGDGVSTGKKISKSSAAQGVKPLTSYFSSK